MGGRLELSTQPQRKVDQANSYVNVKHGGGGLHDVVRELSTRS